MAAALPRAFYARDAATVARDLLGKVLEGPVDGVRRRARIVETEAYVGSHDLASHSRHGPTARNRTMFGPPGHAYVYFVYGIHHCLNAVTGADGVGEAVLLRAAEPLEGWAARLTGPGLLAKGFAVTRADDGADLTKGPLRITDGPPPPQVEATARVGVGYAGDWAHRPLRFLAAGPRPKAPRRRRQGSGLQRLAPSRRMAARKAAGARRRRPAAQRPALHGRVALVTGGAVRIGAAVVRHLAAAGCDVAIHHNTSGAQARALAAELRVKGLRSAAVPGDLSRPADRKRLVGAAAKALGRPLDLLVNNASSFPVRAFQDLTYEDWLDDLTVNAWAPYELTRAFAAQLPPRAEGHVVNFLDARIVDEDRRHAGYHLAKRMLTDMTRLFAIELAPRIAVNAVAPGPTLPPPGMEARKGAALMERLRQRLPLQRTSTPDDLARAVVYLAGSRAHTGQVLFVDGGRHLGRPE